MDTVPIRATTVTTTLDIAGMSCASCTKHVGAALQRVPGVRSATVDLAHGTATVVHQPQVSPQVLAAAVTEEGYAVSAIN